MSRRPKPTPEAVAALEAAVAAELSAAPTVTAETEIAPQVCPGCNTSSADEDHYNAVYLRHEELTGAHGQRVPPDLRDELQQAGKTVARRRQCQDPHHYASPVEVTPEEANAQDLQMGEILRVAKEIEAEALANEQVIPFTDCIHAAVDRLYPASAEPEEDETPEGDGDANQGPHE